MDDWQGDPLFLQAQRLVHPLVAGRAICADQAGTCRERYHHGLEVARLLAHWGAPPELVAAGLLHTFLWKELLTQAQVAEACGQDVATLCKNYQRILQEKPLNRRLGTPQVHRRIRFYVAAYRDPRLALLGVADIWERFQHARKSEGAARRAFAQEADECYVPLLEMLGMRALQDELANWALEHGRERKAYQRLQRLLANERALNAQAFDEVKTRLPEVLVEANPPIWQPHAPGRIYDARYMERAHPEVFETIPIKLIVPEEKRCYDALRAIHELWRPLEGRVVDTINNCKLNGYRALETTVEIPPKHLGRRRLLHFTIVTPEMDEVNQWGVAAALRRDLPEGALKNAWWNRRDEANQHIHAAEAGSQPEILYVFSPQGELFRFPRGCTVVDYAYQVHSDLADQCRTFWLNGVPVEPVTQLHHRDLVWIEHDPRAPGPTQTWFNAARTSRARQRIRRFLRRQGHSLQEGRHILERRREKLEEHYGFRLPDQEVERALQAALQRLNLDRVETLLRKIADGHLSVDKFLHPLFTREIVRQILLPQELGLHEHQVRLAQCCRPRPGDDVRGRVRRREGRAVGLTVHHKDCKHAKSKSAEKVSLEWRLVPLQRSVDRLVVQAMDRDGILGDVLQSVYARSPNLKLHEVRAVARHGRARLELTVEARGDHLLDDLVAELEVLPGHQVDRVRRMGLLPSERAALALPISTFTNPYNRLPVEDPDLFYGREQELRQIHEWLLSGQEMIGIRGQKRVGKTSLLLQLKRQYSQDEMDEHLYPVHSGHFLPVIVDFQTFGHMESNQLFYAIAETIFNELQHSGRIDRVGAPSRTLFQASPVQQMVGYLRDIHSQANLRLLLLMDEFSSTIDAYHSQTLGEHFFAQWKALITATRNFASYVLVVQEQTYNRLISSGAWAEPGASAELAWQVLQLGPSLVLSPLDAQDARDLVQRPVRNYFEYTPEALERVLQLTGRSPFLIQGFCYGLVNHMARSQRRQVTLEDVEEVKEGFLRPGENLCAHLLELVRGRAWSVCTELARLTGPDGHPVSVEALQEALPDQDPERVNSILHEMARKHILTPTEDGRWRFTSLLFASWLTRHPPID